MINKSEIEKLRNLQPLLHIYPNQIKGFFRLSAGFNQKTRSFQYGNIQKESLCYLEDEFQIQINIRESGYPLHTFNTDGKINKWKGKIPDAYWHVNHDGSLCLGVNNDISTFFNALNYADFIHHLLTSYFYYMKYITVKKKEPWEGYRHDKFSWLESKKNILEYFEIIQKLHPSQQVEVVQCILLPVNKLNEIKNQDKCPFCIMQNKKSHKCREHKARIANYNRILEIINVTIKKANEIHSTLNLVA